MSTQRLVIPGAGGAALAARLDLPAGGPPRAYAIFAHCFTCGKDLKAAHTLSQALAAANIAVLRCDFTGLGESEGDFADTSFAADVANLVAAAEFLAVAHAPPALLIGHSLGGAAAIMAAARLPSVRAVATIGAPSSTAHLAHLLADGSPEITAQGCALVSLGGRSFPITRAFLNELEATRIEPAIHDLGRALLICHSPRDKVVSIDNAAQIFQAARHPKSFLSLDTADHLLSARADAEYVAATIVAWAGRYLPAAPASATAAAPAPGVEVRVGAHGYTASVRAGRHQFTVDEPASVGGADLGPNPYDYLLAALGACTAITLRMYADRKSWPLEGVTVRLRHAKIHAADCAECETKDGKIDQIARELELAGPLDAEQRARLREMADRCPVHRTIEGEIQVVTTMRDEPPAS